MPLPPMNFSCVPDFLVRISDPAFHSPRVIKHVDSILKNVCLSIFPLLHGHTSCATAPTDCSYSPLQVGFAPLVAEEITEILENEII